MRTAGVGMSERCETCGQRGPECSGGASCGAIVVYTLADGRALELSFDGVRDPSEPDNPALAC